MWYDVCGMYGLCGMTYMWYDVCGMYGLCGMMYGLCGMMCNGRQQYTVDPHLSGPDGTKPRLDM